MDESQTRNNWRSAARVLQWSPNTEKDTSAYPTHQTGTSQSTGNATASIPCPSTNAPRQRHRIESLPIDERATPSVLQLPDIHRDYFDRIIIAQAIANNILIVTPDNRITRYPVSVIW